MQLKGCLNDTRLVDFGEGHSEIITHVSSMEKNLLVMSILSKKDIT